MYKHHLHKSELKQKLMQEQNSGFLWNLKHTSLKPHWFITKSVKLCLLYKQCRLSKSLANAYIKFLIKIEQLRAVHAQQIHLSSGLQDISAELLLFL